MSFKLNNGHSIPIVAFGTYSVSVKRPLFGPETPLIESSI